MKKDKKSINIKKVKEDDLTIKEKYLLLLRKFMIQKQIIKLNKIIGYER